MEEEGVTRVNVSMLVKEEDEGVCSHGVYVRKLKEERD